MSDAEKQANTVPTAKVGMGSILVAVVAAAVVAVGITAAGAMYVIRSGKIVAAAAAAPQVVEKAAPVKTKPMVLEPMLVNLSDPTGGAYLKVAVTLLVEEEEKKGKEEGEAKGKDKDAGPTAAARDAILAAATANTSTQLLNAEGKEELKKSIREAVRKQAPELKVSEVLFTDFLVQR